MHRRTNHVTLESNEAFRAQWETHSCPTFLLWSERRRNDDPGFPLCRNKVQILCMTEGNQQEALENLSSCSTSTPHCRTIQLSIFVSGFYETEKQAAEPRNFMVLNHLRNSETCSFCPFFTLRPPNKTPEQKRVYNNRYDFIFTVVTKHYYKDFNNTILSLFS